MDAKNYYNPVNNTNVAQGTTSYGLLGGGQFGTGNAPDSILLLDSTIRDLGNTCSEMWSMVEFAKKIADSVFGSQPELTTSGGTVPRNAPNGRAEGLREITGGIEVARAALQSQLSRFAAL